MKDKTPSQVRTASAALLCGGESRRLGFPKEMIRVDGAPLAVRLAERLRCVFADVAVVTNRPAFLSWCTDAAIHTDEFKDLGPLAGIHAGLKNATADRVFFLAADMPLAHIDFVRSFLVRAEGMDAPAVVARTPGKVQPLFGTYDRSLLGAIEKALGKGRLSVTEFLESIDAHYIDLTGDEAACLRDIDGPADLPLLSEAFDEVEPLPVRSLEMTRFGGQSDGLDLAAAEVPVGVFANGARLATVMCLPNALRELALGFVRYLGLARSADDVASIAVDHDAARANLELFVDAAKIRNAVRLLVTSTCGANVYGEQLPDLSVGEKGGARISRTHILETIARLRPMAPVFEKTGCTHQAAWTDGERVRFFFEDVGRHNAVDKIVGAAMLSGSDLGRGALVTTGRLNGEIVVKALRARVPVLASRGATTTNAVRLAENYGLTLVGFARTGRVNVYSYPERIADE